MIQEDNGLPRATGRPFLSALHATQQALLAISLASQQKTTKLHFSSQVIKETVQTFSGSI